MVRDSSISKPLGFAGFLFPGSTFYRFSRSLVPGFYLGMLLLDASSVKAVKIATDVTGCFPTERRASG